MKLTPCGWAFLRAEPQVGVRKKQTIKHTPNMLRIAIQAKGRLNEQSIDLLSEAGIRVAESKRKLISRAEGFPLEVLYLRDDDIPQAVSMGVADLGIDNTVCPNIKCEFVIVSNLTYTSVVNCVIYL